MQHIIQRFALVVCFISLLIHAATFFPAWAASLPLGGLMLMHLAALACFIPTVILINMRRFPRPPSPTPTQVRTMRNERNKAILRAIPLPFKVLCFAAMAYAMVNFVMFMGNMEGGGPHILENGQHVLSNHGTILREISAAEYLQFRIYELRGFSGMWILFSLVSAVLATFGPRAFEQAEGATDH